MNCPRQILSHGVPPLNPTTSRTAGMSLPQSVSRIRTGLALLVVSTVVAVVTLLPMQDPRELTRLRNSMVAEIGLTGDFDWTPQNYPNAFLVEEGPVPSVLRDAVQKIAADRTETQSALSTAIALAQHLASNPARMKGGRSIPIKSATLRTYKAIIEDGHGYCADYTQVFNALGHTARIPTREWGMSFDGFGGDGHAFNEVWDASLGKWVFIDSFHGFYVVDVETSEPLSALEFRQVASTANPERLAAIRVVKAGHFGFNTPREAFEYYGKGTEQFFLWFGNNSLSYDAEPFVEELGQISRALEQLWTITLGIHPVSKVYPSPNATVHFDVMRTNATWFYVGTVSSAVLFLLGVYTLISGLRLRRLPDTMTTG